MTKTITVCPLAEIPPGEKRRVVVGERQVLVVNVAGELFAVDGICSHQYAELYDGYLRGGRITCPLHTSTFDVRTGEPLGPPATEPLATFPVRIESGLVVVDLPEE